MAARVNRYVTPVRGTNRMRDNAIDFDFWKYTRKDSEMKKFTENLSQKSCTRRHESTCLIFHVVVCCHSHDT